MKKSFLRGIFAGFFTLILSIIVFAVLASLFKMLVWPMISGVPYTRSLGGIVVGSREWYLMQPLGFLSAVLSGIATARWSKPNSRSALLAVLVIAVCFVLASPIQTNSILNLLIWNLEIPIGLLMGFYFYKNRRREAGGNI